MSASPAMNTRTTNSVTANSIIGWRPTVKSGHGRVGRDFTGLYEPCTGTGSEGQNLRWVLLHLINETARHAGQADATRELLD